MPERMFEFAGPLESREVRLVLKGTSEGDAAIELNVGGIPTRLTTCGDFHLETIVKLGEGARGKMIHVKLDLPKPDSSEKLASISLDTIDVILMDQK